MGAFSPTRNVVLSSYQYDLLIIIIVVIIIIIMAVNIVIVLLFICVVIIVIIIITISHTAVADITVMNKVLSTSVIERQVKTCFSGLPLRSVGETVHSL